MTAKEAVGFMRSLRVLGRNCGDVRLIQKLLNKEVNSSGAVSPAALATANMTPVRIPDKAVGTTTCETTWVGVAPMPTAASRIRGGTLLIASSAVRRIVGSIRS